MSTDYDAICDHCRKWIHAGQHMGGRDSFGYGSDDDGGRAKVAAWIFVHAECGNRAGVRIVASQSPAGLDA